MRVLIYIEPLVEREKPLWKRGWVEAFGPKFHGALLAGGVEAGDIAFVVPEPFVDEAKVLFPGSMVVTISHSVFVPSMVNDALALARAWYEGNRAIAQDEQLAAILRDALHGFTPDLAISYTPAPFLKQVWPGLPVAHFEVGMFSRRPYPMTIYLDPFGMFRQGAPARFAKDLSKRVPTLGETALIETIRERYGLAMFGDANPFYDSLKNPFRGSTKPILDDYARVALLALQFSDFYAYDAHARYRSQYDWLIATLENTPPDMALIVTEHPDHPLFDDSTFAFLRRRYPNLVWMPKFREVHAATQFLVEYADTVITVSSSIGWQCLLWKKRLIVCGNSHLDVIADSHDLTDIGRMPDAVWPQYKDNLLAWLISHYYITMEQFEKPGWLVEYLQRMMTTSTQSLGAAWFTETADPADLERFYGYHAGKIVTEAAPSTASDTQASSSATNPARGDLSLDRVRETAPIDADTPVPIPWPPLSIAQADEAYMEAGRLLASGDKNGAIAILEHLWARQCKRWDVYCDLGALLLDAGRTASAIAALRVALALEPDSTLTLRNLAAAYLATGDFAQLLVVCRMLLKQEPGNAEYITFLRDVVLSTDMKFDDYDWLFSQPRGVSMYTGWQAIHGLSEQKWQKVLIDSVKTPSYLGFPLPGFPPAELQVAIMGSSNADGLREGFRFYGLVKSVCEENGSRLTPDMQLLDFGTGWGRFARIFLKEFPPENILGIDVDKSLVDVCRNTFPYGRFEVVPALPPTTLPSDHFGLVVAYSVFSHLSETAANAWIQEFSRILRPGGVIAVTTQGRTFLDFCEGIRQRGDFDHPWHRNLAKSFNDVERCKRAYDRGEFLFSPTGGGDARPSTFYGETLIPEQYVRNVWSEWLEPLAFIDDRQRLPQALIVMRKRSDATTTAEYANTRESGQA